MKIEHERAPAHQARNVLVPLYHEAFALNQLCLYEEMLGKVAWRPVLLNPIGRRFDAIVAERGYSIIPDYISPPRNSGYWHASGVDEGHVYSEPRINRRRFKNVLRKLLGTRPSSMLVEIYMKVKLPYDIFRWVRKYSKQIDYLCKLIHKEGICAIVLAESSPAYGAVVFREAARRCNIILITNTYSKDSPANYADIYAEDPTRQCNKIENVILAFLFPKWVYRPNGKLLRLPAAEVAAQEIIGISPPQPWATIGELEDAVCVESMSDFDFYKKLGVNEDKIFLTGTGRLDRLAGYIRSRESIKKDVLGELGFDGDRPILLCLLPQTHWVAGRSIAEFQSHSEMLQTWIDALMTQDRFNVIVSLHPSMLYDRFTYLETDRIKISRRSVFELISVCSLFVSSGSTTTTLAIAAKLPVITYDTYRNHHLVNDPEFFVTKRVVTVFNRKDFEDVMVRIATDEDFLEDMKHSDAKEAEYFGVLDGGAVNRILSVIERLVGSKDMRVDTIHGYDRVLPHVT